MLYVSTIHTVGYLSDKSANDLTCILPQDWQGSIIFETELEVVIRAFTNDPWRSIYRGDKVTFMLGQAGFSVTWPISRDQTPLVLLRDHPSETTLDDLGLREQFVIAVSAVKHSMNVCATEILLML